jgi:hypothetical protein
MNRPLVFGLLVGVATWTLVVNSHAERRARVKAADAAEKLRMAWADHHTTA